MEGPGAIIKHDEVRKVAGKESWVASFLPQLKPFVRQLWTSLFKHSTGDKINFCVQATSMARTIVVADVP